MKLNEKGKLSLRAKIAYGSGDLANNLIMQMVLVYLLFFYTDIFGIPAAVAGTMFIVSRVLDAITDIVMGLIVDKTDTRWGKMRPYLLFGSVPFGIAAVLCFTTPSFDLVGKIVYAYVTYNLLCIMLTVIGIPYGALSSAITQDASDRVGLSVWRSLFGTVGGVAVNVITPIVAPIITGGDLQSGYALTMSIYAVVGVVVFLLVFLNTKEVCTVKTTEKVPLKTLIKTTFGNKYVLLISLSMALSIGSTNIRASAVVYYFTYYLKRDDLLPIFFLVVYGSIALGMLLVGPVTKKLGRRNSLIATLIFFGAVNSVIFLAPPTNAWLVMVCNVLGGIATAFTASLPLALMPDAVDYSQWKYGVRTEGVIFSFNSFAQKIAMALGGAIPAYMLSITGYVAGGEQTPRALKGIAAIMSIVPGVVLVLAAVVILFYDMDEKKFGRIVNDLKAGKTEFGTLPEATTKRDYEKEFEYGSTDT